MCVRVACEPPHGGFGGGLQATPAMMDLGAARGGSPTAVHPSNFFFFFRFDFLIKLIKKYIKVR
jgi:hypothetical protein